MTGMPDMRIATTIHNINACSRRMAGLCIALSLAGFTLNSLAWYPGFMSPDSIDQYTQALHNSYGDWHPPIMSGLWSLLLPVYNGPQPMFFLQMGLLWVSAYLLLRVFASRYPYLFFLPLLLACAPFVQNFAGVIWKDVQMGLSWLLAFSIMLSAFFEKRPMSRVGSVLSLLLLSYGCWVRINALPGLIPLLGLWLYLLKRPVNINRHLIIFTAKTLGLALLVVLAQAIMTKWVLKPNKDHAEYKLFAHDLAGIYVKTGDNGFPAFIRDYEGFDTAYLRQHYRYSTFDNIWWNGDGKKLLPGLDDARATALRKAWLGAIYRHPGAYLHNRGLGFLDFLRITNSGSDLCTFYPQVHPNVFGFSYAPNRLGKFCIGKISDRWGALYMKPWFWLLLNGLLLALAFVKNLAQVRQILLVLSLSSLFYIVFEFFIFPADTELRYFYWNGIALSLSCLLAAGEISNTFFLRRARAKQ